VIGGPAQRVWLFRDDPRHAWIRDTWIGRETDQRLPMTAP
jgi:5-deoxy-glucuronate isomerase